MGSQRSCTCRIQAEMHASTAGAGGRGYYEQQIFLPEYLGMTQVKMLGCHMIASALAWSTKKLNRTQGQS